MSADVTLCFYLVIGAAVTVALWISDPGLTRARPWFRSITTLLFWPIYLPVLLARNASSSPVEMLVRDGRQRRPEDEMAAAIKQVESELDTALRSLDGWAEAALGPAADRFAELRAAWRQQAERVRELDRLLTSDAKDIASLEASTTEAGPAAANSPATNRFAESERSRRENLVKLKLVRQQCQADLMATLAWVRQLVTMIHLARYTGAPASRAAELVQQIADAVEGLATVYSPSGLK